MVVVAVIVVVVVVVILAVVVVVLVANRQTGRRDRNSERQREHDKAGQDKTDSMRQDRYDDKADRRTRSGCKNIKKTEANGLQGPSLAQ